MVFDIVLVVIAVVLVAILLSKRVRNDRTWRATVTPLASIIGSGFLVIVPLLGNAVGLYAPLAITGIVVVAYAIGSIIRFNIRYAEETSAAGAGSPRIDSIASIALAFSYFISVTFYLRLLASFVFENVGAEAVVLEQALTTAILLFIGGAGWLWGLGFLERLEEYTVSIKLAIIGALLAGWAVHDVGEVATVDWASLRPESLDAWYVTRVLAGILIVVQGFETSRYLGDEYDQELRIVSMRRAQLLSGVVYILFVLFALPSFGLLGDDVSETAIIALSASVASVLPMMLIVAAVMSQLSAAVADTVGSGGLLAEGIGKRLGLSSKIGYVLVAVVGIVLIWTANVFELVSLASRAFAIYYAIQSLIAAKAASVVCSGIGRTARIVAFLLMGVLLMACAVIAIPAG